MFYFVKRIIDYARIQFSRFYCQAVDRCRNDECNPTHEVVYSSVLFH